MIGDSEIYVVVVGCGEIDSSGVNGQEGASRLVETDSMSTSLWRGLVGWRRRRMLRDC